MLEPATLRFLSALRENNNKSWFDSHRTAYEAARIDFANFIQLVIDALEQEDPELGGMQARDCLFRINRDVRFSNDKSPYKSNFGASIKRAGKKSLYAGYYFHLEPGGNSFIGGGLWMPDASRLKAVRQEIDYNWEEFQAIVQAPPFRKVFGDLYQGADQRLSTMPKGYEKDNPAAAYLKLKSFIAETHLADVELTKATLHKKTLEGFRALMPLLEFINRTVE